MRLGITYTIHSKKDDQEFLIEANKQFIELMKKEYKEKEYSIIKLVVGLHKRASRLHTHIFHIIQVDDSKDVKFWNKKLGQLFKSKDENIELRMSIYRETDPLYKEHCGLAYPLKEYEKNEDIILRELFINMTDEEVENLREDAHKIYTKSIAEHERNEERKRQEEDETSQIFQFIKDYIEPKNRKTEFIFAECNFDSRYILVKVAILEYYEQRAKNTGKKRFKAYSIKDLAISFLTTENLVDKFELAKFLN
jgi:hypothetical protein